jgi:hypothetical protein
MSRFFNDIINRFINRWSNLNWRLRLNRWWLRGFVNRLRSRLGRWYLRLWYWLWDRFW